MTESEIERRPGEASPVGEGTVQLKDGRSIVWTAWGASEGKPVLAQPHIGVSGRRALPGDVKPHADASIRLISICRPGLGESSPNRGRTVLNDAHDMLQITDALKLDAITVLGECGGTGAALALAARRPERVKLFCQPQPHHYAATR